MVATDLTADDRSQPFVIPDEWRYDASSNFTCGMRSTVLPQNGPDGPMRLNPFSSTPGLLVQRPYAAETFQ